MAQKQHNAEFEKLKKTLETGGRPDRVYLFYGEERYLLEHYLGKLRESLAGGGFSEFNYHRFTGSSFSVDALAAACDALPVFSERTLVEVHGLEITKAAAELREGLAALTADLPDHVCLVFVSGAGSLEADELKKLKVALGPDAEMVRFDVQETPKLIKWIAKHFAGLGKSIDASTAEYLAFVTGGSMTALRLEIDKLASFTQAQTVTREDIDMLVTPVPDAQLYTMTDHLAACRFDKAAAVMTDLLSMQEPPHKLMFSISLKLRQQLLARLLTAEGGDLKQLMKTAGIRYEFQARNLMAASRGLPAARCRQNVLLAAEAAYRMNTGDNPEQVLSELLLRLASNAGNR